MANKKTLTIVVLISIAVVFIMLFFRMPSQTPKTAEQAPSTETSVNPSTTPTDGTTATPPDQSTGAPNPYR